MPNQPNLVVFFQNNKLVLWSKLDLYKFIKCFQKHSALLKKKIFCIDTACTGWTKVGGLQNEIFKKRLNNGSTESYIGILLDQPVKHSNQNGNTKLVMTKCVDGSKIFEWKLVTESDV